MKCRLKKFTYCCSILFFFGKKNIFYSENILHIIANGNDLYVNIFDGVFKTKKNMGVGGGGGELELLYGNHKEIFISVDVPLGSRYALVYV